MSALKIALLGPPEVCHRDHRLTFPERKVMALLAYLAAERDMQERQKLTRLLWPESDMAHGRTALRITLLHLRRILEEDASPEGESHVLITHDTLGLDLASGIDLDLHALEAAWMLMRCSACTRGGEGRGPPHPDYPTSTRRQYSTAGLPPGFYPAQYTRLRQLGRHAARLLVPAYRAGV